MPEQLADALDVLRSVADVIISEHDILTAREINAGVDAIHLAVEIRVLRTHGHVTARLAPSAMMLLEYFRRRAIDDDNLAAYVRELTEIFEEVSDFFSGGRKPADREEVRTTKTRRDRGGHAALWSAVS